LACVASQIAEIKERKMEYDYIFELKRLKRRIKLLKEAMKLEEIASLESMNELDFENEKSKLKLGFGDVWDSNVFYRSFLDST